MIEQEKASAIKAIPEGFFLVLEGNVGQDDLLWDYVHARWNKVTPPKPFVKGQKRPGWGQMTAIGDEVSRYVAVARKA